MSLKPKFIPYFSDLVTRYQCAHPEVRIEWVDFPWDILQLKLITAIAARRPPALVQLSVPWAEELARNGWLQPVDAGLDVSQYTAAALADVRFAGRVYGYPHYSNVNVIAYNRTLLEQAGLNAPPADLASLLEMARTLARRTGRPGYAPALGKIDGFFLQQGLPLIEQGQAVFNRPAHLALLEALRETYRAGGFLKDKLFAEDNFPPVVEAYMSGRLGMMVSAPTALKRVRQDAPLMYRNTGVFPAPVGPTGLADGGWTFHFAVPHGVPVTSLPDIARFAAVLTGAEEQLAFARMADVMPTARRALGDPYFQANPAPGAADPALQARSVAAHAVAHAPSLYVAGVDDYDTLRRFLVQAVESGITGQRPLQAAMDEACARWNVRLARQRGVRT